jgi:hypothetical protein
MLYNLTSYRVSDGPSKTTFHLKKLSSFSRPTEQPISSFYDSSKMIFTILKFTLKLLSENLDSVIFRFYHDLNYKFEYVNKSSDFNRSPKLVTLNYYYLNII